MLLTHISLVVLGADVQHLLDDEHVAGAGVRAHGQRGLAQRLLRLGEHLQGCHGGFSAFLATWNRKQVSYGLVYITKEFYTCWKYLLA